MLTVLVVVVADDAATTTSSLADVTRPAADRDERFERMLVWARANPGGRRLAPLPPPPSPSSVQLVGVDVRRRHRGTTSAAASVDHVDDDDATNSTTRHEAGDVDASLSDQLHRNRIR